MLDDIYRLSFSSRVKDISQLYHVIKLLNREFRTAFPLSFTSITSLLVISTVTGGLYDCTFIFFGSIVNGCICRSHLTRLARVTCSPGGHEIAIWLLIAFFGDAKPAIESQTHTCSKIQ